MVQKELIFFPTWVAGRKGYADRIRQMFEEYLRTKGQRLTKPRSLILDHLLEADVHLSSDNIYQALRKHGVGSVTVFRTLKMLEESKLVERVTSPNGRPKFEVKIERPHHDHLVCVECGGITEIQWPDIEKIQERTCKQVGFVAMWHRHEIFGKCGVCAAK